MSSGDFSSPLNLSQITTEKCRNLVCRHTCIRSVETSPVDNHEELRASKILPVHNPTQTVSEIVEYLNRPLEFTEIVGDDPSSGESLETYSKFCRPFAVIRCDERTYTRQTLSVCNNNRYRTVILSDNLGQTCNHEPISELMERNCFSLPSSDSISDCCCKSGLVPGGGECSHSPSTSPCPTCNHVGNEVYITELSTYMDPYDNRKVNVTYDLESIPNQSEPNTVDKNDSKNVQIVNSGRASNEIDTTSGVYISTENISISDRPVELEIVDPENISSSEQRQRTEVDIPMFKDKKGEYVVETIINQQKNVGSNDGRINIEPSQKTPEKRELEINLGGDKQSNLSEERPPEPASLENDKVNMVKSHVDSYKEPMPIEESQPEPSKVKVNTLEIYLDSYKEQIPVEECIPKPDSLQIEGVEISDTISDDLENRNKMYCSDKTMEQKGASDLKGPDNVVAETQVTPPSVETIPTIKDSINQITTTLDPIQDNTTKIPQREYPQKSLDVIVETSVIPDSQSSAQRFPKVPQVSTSENVDISPPLQSHAIEIITKDSPLESKKVDKETPTSSQPISESVTLQSKPVSDEKTLPTHRIESTKEDTAPSEDVSLDIIETTPSKYVPKHVTESLESSVDAIKTATIECVPVEVFETFRSDATTGVIETAAIGCVPEEVIKSLPSDVTADVIETGAIKCVPVEVIKTLPNDVPVEVTESVPIKCVPVEVIKNISSDVSLGKIETVPSDISVHIRETAPIKCVPAKTIETIPADVDVTAEALKSVAIECVPLEASETFLTTDIIETIPIKCVPVEAIKTLPSDVTTEVIETVAIKCVPVDVIDTVPIESIRERVMEVASMHSISDMRKRFSIDSSGDGSEESTLSVPNLNEEPVCLEIVPYEEVPSESKADIQIIEPVKEPVIQKDLPFIEEFDVIITPNFPSFPYEPPPQHIYLTEVSECNLLPVYMTQEGSVSFCGKCMVNESCTTCAASCHVSPQMTTQMECCYSSPASKTIAICLDDCEILLDLPNDCPYHNWSQIDIEIEETPVCAVSMANCTAACSCLGGTYMPQEPPTTTVHNNCCCNNHYYNHWSCGNNYCYYNSCYYNCYNNYYDCYNNCYNNYCNCNCSGKCKCYCNESYNHCCPHTKYT